MVDFLRNSDAFVWSIEGDPRLRSTIVTLVLFDRTPNWEQLVNRFEVLSRTMPMFRQRVMPSRTRSQPRNFGLGRCLVEAAELDRYWAQFVAL